MKKTSLFKQYIMSDDILVLPGAHDSLCADHQKCTTFCADLNRERCADLFDTRDDPLAACPDAVTERSGTSRNKFIETVDMLLDTRSSENPKYEL
jgi:hypothetical protein